MHPKKRGLPRPKVHTSTWPWTIGAALFSVIEETSGIDACEGAFSPARTPIRSHLNKWPGGTDPGRVIILSMVSLLMLRHAKSDWKVEYGHDDLHRPLAKRGVRAARAIGRFLAETGQVPDRALVSPALRATQTLDLAARAGHWECRVSICDELYGGVEDVFEAIRDRGGDSKLLMIVGHQPAWSLAASRLASGAAFDLPTASLLRLDFNEDIWSTVQGNGLIRWLVTPHLLAEERRSRRTAPAGGKGRRPPKEGT